MAEWRARGYVADSDEEDDSQPTSLSNPSASHRASVNIDDTVDAFVPSKTYGRVPAEEEIDDVLVQVKEGKEAGKDGPEASRKPTTSQDLNEHLHQEKPDGTSILPVTTDIYGHWAESANYDDVDELQQDHYDSKPHVQPQAEPPQEAQERSSPKPSSAALRSNIQSLYSTASSPLSSISPEPYRLLSSNARPPSEIDYSEAEDDSHASPALHSSGLQVRQTNHMRSSVPENTSSGGRVRNLRRRNPIQLHPYQIESEKYRQILKARGVKPLRITQMEAEASRAGDHGHQYRKDDTEDSQLREWEGEDATSSPPLATQDTAGDTSPRPRETLLIEDDELPDLSTLLRNPSITYVGNGFKRRKMTTPSSKVPVGSMLGQQLFSPAKLALEDEDRIFDVLPSPAQSRSPISPKLIRRSKPIFRYPRMSSPTALPTPVTSSEPRQRAFLDVTGNSQEVHSSPQRAGTVSQARSSDSSDASSDEGSSSEVQRAQRKIRGVLPASWLKLDLKSQKTTATSRQDYHSSPSPDKGNLQRGVARPVAPRARKNPALSKLQNWPIEISEYERSSSENGDSQEGIYGQQDNMPCDEDMDIFSAGRLGEAAEDDRIDAMLPTARRERAQHRNKRTTQRQLVGIEGQSLSGCGNLAKEAWISRPNQSRTTQNLVEFPKRESAVHPSTLSILDSHMTPEPPQMPVPPFLRIASRTARARKDKGRHSPSRKYLRLAAEQDDNDTNKTLKDWREGTITQTPSVYSDLKTRRSALYPRSANSTLPSKTPDRIKSPRQLRVPSLKSSSATAHTRFRRPRKVQTSLEHLIAKGNRTVFDPSDVPEDMRVQKTHHKPRKQGQILSTLQSPYDMRPAMLEVPRGNSDQKHAQMLFERDLSRINYFDDESGLPNVLRLFDRKEGITPVDHPVHPKDREGNNSGTNVRASKRQSTVHRLRKRRPKHMESSAFWFGHPGAAVDADDLPGEPPFAGGSRTSKNVLLGLKPFGTRYSDTCDIAPLPTGTCFHETSILGSGILAKSLRLANPSVLNGARGYLVRVYNQRTFRWGPWNDTVSSELGIFTCLTTQAIQDAWAHGDKELTAQSSRKAISMLKDIITYFSDHVTFLDDIDRIACVQRSKLVISEMLNEVDQCSPNELESATQGTLGWRSHFRHQVGTLNLILLNSIYRLAKHELVSAQLRQDVQSILRKSAELTLKLALNGDLEAFGACIIHLRHSTTANYIIGEQQHAVEAFVVAHHVVSQHQDLRTMTLEMIQAKVPTTSPEGLYDVLIMEQCWQRLFTLLPFLEFDTKGVLETGRRFKTMFENWTLVKKLIGPVLEVSLKNPRGQAPSFNAYCRAVFGRCLRLINDWGWRRCEAIIGTLFDFFARNSLAHLRNEESHGSPPFLGQLDKNPPLIVEPEDRVFHILLKIIGSGIKHMVQVYPEKRVRDIVWRLMPNHGRFHPKEESIRQEDLDALRNHHDLLCTLYWASPSGCRPRLSVIRNLVNLETSHREACHITIRTWYNLVRFQLSTDEPVESLVPFAEWHDDLVSQILRQHALARSEAEDHVISALQDGGLTVSKDLLESTIARNQRQVEGILSDALVCLKLAVDAAAGEQAAAKLLSTTVTKVFDLFDAGRPQVSKVIVQALDIVFSYTSKSLTQIKVSQNDNDDSQDYGDWPALDEDDDLGPPSDGPEGLPLIAFQEPLRHFLSNCFGSDLVPDDSLMLKLVDVWLAVAQALVRKGVKSWHDYVDRFGTDSWVSLRDTEQTRKYSVYYLAVLVERDSGIVRDHPTFFLTSWIASLVERDSMLKFQHRLTEALLNSACGEPIISNLPFWADASTGLFRISGTEFAERRLSIISTVLSNMRMTLEYALANPAMDAMHLRQEYKDLLKHLMGTMKHNYQELGHGSNVRGAYVGFVHKVVEFLQQHTSTICPIDRFFTDNGTFPLPATDPTYVVGQLKNYGLRLQDARTPKQLIAFLQSVSERAAVDGQQPYLVGQLHVAMSNTFEDGTDARPTLRSFIVQAVVPAYINMAFSYESGWILALPFLQALRKVFGELLMDFDGTNSDGITAVTSIATAFLDAVRQPMATLLHLSNPFKEARLLKTLSACYSATTALLPLWDYLVRLPGSTVRAEKNISLLRSFAAYLLALLRDDDDIFPPETDFAEGPTNSEIGNFATLELKDTLIKNWKCHDGRHYVIRGSTRREVVVDIGLFEEEKEELSRCLEEFLGCLRAMPAFIDDDENDSIPQRMIVYSMDALVF